MCLWISTNNSYCQRHRKRAKKTQKIEEPTEGVSNKWLTWCIFAELFFLTFLINRDPILREKVYLISIPPLSTTKKQSSLHVSFELSSKLTWSIFSEIKYKKYQNCLRRTYNLKIRKERGVRIWGWWWNTYVGWFCASRRA